VSDREIFNASLEFADPAQRSAYLDQACAGDAALRRQIEGLLEMHAQLGSFLESPAEAGAMTVDQSASPEGTGTVIGPYKLLQEIGEGGMGTVWMAEQTQPVQRKVALKIIKAGLDSRHVLARFEAERQALALMDHPNIAKVLDAGTVGSRQQAVKKMLRCCLLPAACCLLGIGRTSSWNWSRACPSPNTATNTG
jgi:hypothetical protein